MADYDPALDDLEDGDLEHIDQRHLEQMVRMPTKDFEALRRAAGASDQLVKRVGAQKRAIEMIKALRGVGLDVEDKKVQYFLRGYDGQAEAAAIKQAAAEAGLIAPEDEPIPPERVIWEE